MKIPWNRYQTYRKPDDARRSFYRWVCKQELYGALKIIHHGRWTWHDREREKMNYGGVGFARGYPTFHASRSEARRQWENEALVHFERIAEEREKAARAKLFAESRVRTAERMKHSQFFKLQAAAPLIKKVGT